MFLDLDHWREIGTVLSANRARTALTAFGVAWAVFMLLVMVGAGNGLRNGVTREFEGAATNSFFIWTNRTSKPWKGLPPGRNFRLDVNDVRVVARQVPEVLVVAPRSQLGGFDGGFGVTRGSKAGGFGVMGDVPEMDRITPFTMQSGRWLNDLDIALRRKVAVIGPRVQQTLFEKGEDPLGQSLWIRGVAFMVVGTFSVRTGGDDADREAQAVHVPLSTFQVAFNDGNRVGWLAVMTRPDSPAEEVEGEVLALLKRRHDVAPDDNRAFGHWNMATELGRIQGVFVAIRTLTWIVSLGTLLAGAIGVSNVMLVVVRERTREIGIRRAIGATPAAIGSQIVLEAMLLTMAAGYVGLLGGIGVMELTARILDRVGDTSGMFANPEVDLGSALQAVALLVAAGVLAGLVPAHRAIAVHPVEALRGP